MQHIWPTIYYLVYRYWALLLLWRHPRRHSEAVEISFLKLEKSRFADSLQSTRCRRAEWEREGWNHIIIFGSPPEIWTRRRRRKGRMRRRPERRQIYRSAGVAAAAASFSSKTGFWDEWVRSFFYRFRCHGESFIVREWVAWNTSRAQT